ncbi:NAD(P)-dependent oxidoreductase [Sinosporangium siamense]|uniref:3-hydroxyisobutyrate dehydrogenase n=1 Tax=Sinosporangium siamense TaxID=1367973 RepID=A0A919RGV6_9ACTN|nr:NAD(P)-dependent oxidoreductase [Sinosporangium siamense]GII91599.1 3-hydroxyisobutyrate dehydrogenase [Sinosporangium siamense]
MNRTSRTSIAFIGLGTMGFPMARQLVRSGHPVTVVPHISMTAAYRLAEEGAVIATTPADAARDADVVITMLTSATEVSTVLFGESGVTGTARPGTLVMDMSTIGPKAARSIARRLRDADLVFLDSPVSGGPARAEDGTLTAIVGADEGTLEAARPILARMAGTVFHAGPVGAGQAAKICNNILVAACMLANAEALALGTAVGVDPHTLREIILASSGANWQLENIVPQTILANDFAPRFALSLLLKDLDIAGEAADDAGSPFHVGGLARQMFGQAEASFGGRTDFSAVVKLYREALGDDLRDRAAEAATGSSPDE